MAGEKNKSIFRVLSAPLLAVIALQIAFMLGSLLLGGVFPQLSRNMEDILEGQVENRGSYLLNEMIGSWSELDDLSESINQSVQESLDSGAYTLDELCGARQAYTPLLNEAAQLLIDAMHAKQVSGAFIILAGPSEPRGDGLALPGLWFRDRDPQARPSQRLEDILVQRAPRGVVQTGHLTTDTNWTPLISARDSVEQDYFKPYDAALQDAGGKRAEAEDYGYWTCEPYTLSGDGETAISYSIPLMLEDGTVYGVLGVELLTGYVESLLPVEELNGEGYGAYFLAVSRDGGALEPVVLSGHILTPESLAQDHFVLSEDGTHAADSGDHHYAAVKPLALYSRNAPFEGDRWYLLGVVPEARLYAFIDQLARLCTVSAVLGLLVGLFGILLVSYRISRPIQRLARQVELSRDEGRIPELPKVRILEIDQLVDAVTRLSQEVLASSTRFLNIIGMASVDLAGYEVRDGSDDVYVTDNLFRLLDREDMQGKAMTAEQFSEFEREAVWSLEHTPSEDGSTLLTVPLRGGGVRYLRLEEMREDNRRIGLIEDVTSSVLERKKVETERDHDALTGLLNRQGFRREAERLFARPGRLKAAAMLMLDMDHLKATNDKFGHGVGDQYIRQMGLCLRDNTPGSALCARISGDEFLVLYYGFGNRDEIWQQVRQLFQAIRNVAFILPDGVDNGLSGTGGVAWYGKDSRDLSELMKYSDFAMYCMKKQERGGVCEFDAVAYQEMLTRNQLRQEFYQLLEQRRINYHFQPIFDGRTGEPFAYEALMRPDMPNLRSPLAVLEIAREMDRMRDMETLTVFGASESYERLLERREVSPDALLFLNSIADTSMTAEDDERYGQRFQPLLQRLVIEITETETLDLRLVEQKRNLKGFSGMLALDDYGSGYNTELNLLEINPAFIKVDTAIVRNIHQDEDKQHLVRNIVEYAHKRGMRIIAEGLEYPEEVEKSLELGVDLLQGYFLAKPGAVPPPISEEALALIRAYWARTGEQERLGE